MEVQGTPGDIRLFVAGRLVVGSRKVEAGRLAYREEGVGRIGVGRSLVRKVGRRGLLRIALATILSASHLQTGGNRRTLESESRSTPSPSRYNRVFSKPISESARNRSRTTHFA